MKKRLAIRLVIIATVFATVFGLADTLNLSAGSLGAAEAVIAACQSTALTTAFTSTYSATQPGYQVTTVTISGMATTCQSRPFRITLSGAAGASLGEATGTTPASGTTFAGTFTVNAASVTGVAVVISG
ncbi:MAG TPA: hypothetical protein VF990_00265 [Candidatus Dormibacteraeota bacterium]